MSPQTKAPAKPSGAKVPSTLKKQFLEEVILPRLLEITRDTSYESVADLHRRFCTAHGDVSRSLFDTWLTALDAKVEKSISITFPSSGRSPTTGRTTPSGSGTAIPSGDPVQMMFEDLGLPRGLTQLGGDQP